MNAPTSQAGIDSGIPSTPFRTTVTMKNYHVKEVQRYKKFLKQRDLPEDIEINAGLMEYGTALRTTHKRSTIFTKISVIQGAYARMLNKTRIEQSMEVKLLKQKLRKATSARKKYLSAKKFHRAVTTLRREGETYAAHALSAIWFTCTRMRNLRQIQTVSLKKEGKYTRWWFWPKSHKTSTFVGQTGTCRLISTRRNKKFVRFLKKAGKKPFEKVNLSRIAAVLRARKVGARRARRGALQHLAFAGATVAQLRIFSKHTSDETLFRYVQLMPTDDSLLRKSA